MAVRSEQMNSMNVEYDCI